MSCANGILTGSGSGTSSDMARGQCAIVTKVLNKRLDSLVTEINDQLPAVIAADISAQLPALVAASVGDSLALKADVSAVSGMAIMSLDMEEAAAKINALIDTKIAAIPAGPSGGITQGALDAAVAPKADVTAVPAIVVSSLDLSAAHVKINALIDTKIAAIPAGSSGGVSQDYVDGMLALKADAGSIETIDTLASKVALQTTKTYVDTALLTKASAADVLDKVSQAALTATLGDYALASDLVLKADQADHAALVTDVGTKAPKSAVDAINKRSLNYASVALRFVPEQRDGSGQVVVPAGTVLSGGQSIPWSDLNVYGVNYPTASVPIVFTPGDVGISVGEGLWKVTISVDVLDGNSNMLRLKSLLVTDVDTPLFASQVVGFTADAALEIVNDGQEVVTIMSAFMTIERVGDLA